MEIIFHAALERSPESRRQFLDQACGGDAELRQEIEQLISSGSSGAFLSQGAQLGRTLTLAVQQSLIEQRIGPYQVVSLLGAGGMGEVYRATDTRLHR
jgi:hypothetical protein